MGYHQDHMNFHIIPIRLIIPIIYTVGSAAIVLNTSS